MDDFLLVDKDSHGAMLEHIGRQRERIAELEAIVSAAPCPAIQLQLWNMKMISRELGSNGLCEECDCWKREALKEEG